MLAAVGGTAAEAILEVAGLIAVGYPVVEYPSW